jgi:hypothetical protein
MPKFRFLVEERTLYEMIVTARSGHHAEMKMRDDEVDECEVIEHGEREIISCHKLDKDPK